MAQIPFGSRQFVNNKRTYAQYKTLQMTLKHIFLLYTKFKNTNLIKNAYETLYTQVLSNTIRL